MPFKRSLAAHRDQLDRDGYILLKDVLSDRFMASLQDFLERSRKGEVAALTGLDHASFTISERHLKQYETDAPDYPAPHKDRGASKFSIGLPIHLGSDTSVCVFPNLDRSPNDGERAVFMTEQDHPGLKDIYESPEALPLHEQLGDMIVFLGSAIYHERIRPRGTAVLYIKVNDEGFDPLGENIYAPEPALESA
jgi:hypothetical protein